ncbi:hypothetical protein QJS10_CPB17g00933 [Acorus calamus]|uniref:Uncharacterized protein n=1 Tax=Acorus calamus TaxID=4465 RepID=A0AAV9CTZ2_ACOCL|nr:hypothetical protein QJS10_CPB17g00933 [Acorus calamus]
MECAPERVTISSADKPFSRNLALSWSALKVGNGRFSRTSGASETLPSRLPEGTW